MSPTSHERVDGPVDYRAVNSEGWDMLSLLDDPGPPDQATARTSLDPFGWIPWDEIRSVLCLAGGGGYWAPLFACLGHEVTVVDLSAGQLERDRQIAREEGLTIECVQADMLDLAGALGGRQFDLVYQPVSACYVPDPTRMYREVAATVRAGGRYVVKHWSPSQLQVARDVPWDGSAYRVDRPAAAGEPLLWRSDETWSGKRITCLHFGHTLDALLGGICDAGFDIIGFREPDVGDVCAEPVSDAHLSAYFPPFIWVHARRRST